MIAKNIKKKLRPGHGQNMVSEKRWLPNSKWPPTIIVIFITRLLEDTYRRCTCPIIVSMSSEHKYGYQNCIKSNMAAKKQNGRRIPYIFARFWLIIYIKANLWAKLSLIVSLYRSAN
jgi:hypothetical protein